MSRIFDRLEAARRSHFVGRAQPLALFRSLVEEPNLEYLALYVYGPGGLGKTTLLHEYRRMSQDRGLAVFYVDARNIEATPDQFLQSLRQRLELPATGAIPDLLAERARQQRVVLMLDTFETLAGIDDWLREIFLPQLPENLFLIIAGREELGPGWRQDAGWRTLLRTVALRNLMPAESRELLHLRNVPQDQHRTIIDFTHGHPLALSLVADVFDQRPNFTFIPERATDIIEALVAQLLDKVPGPAHRATLEVCSLVRGTTEALLSALLQVPESNELFLWLRDLSFIESGPRGLFPHDLARAVLHADLRWRNPVWFGELHERARRYYTERFEQTGGVEQQRALFDLIYLHRENPMVRSMFEWSTTAGLLPDQLRGGDVAQICEIVATQEGQESAEIANYWLARQLSNGLVFRDIQDTIIGFLLTIDLTLVGEADLEVDPGVRAVHRYLQTHAPLRAGEIATVFRFWMAVDTYQEVSPVQSLIFTNMVRHYLVTPRLAHTFIPCVAPEFWATGFAYADLARLTEADFIVAGQHYGVYGHDWRVTPPVAWLTLMGEREMGISPEPISAPPVISTLVLSEEEFAQAVKRALQQLAQPERLFDNPLLQSRVIKGHVTEDAKDEMRVVELQNQIRHAVEQLAATPRERKFYRAVYHTYIQPASTQENAAELLDLPFSTYRRHLTNGIKAVTDTLWRLETGDNAHG